MFNIVFTAEDCDELKPSKKSDCTDYTLTDDDKSDGIDACCYETYKYQNTEYKKCDYATKKLITKE